MFIILIFVIALVAWALHLMQEAVENKEFSLMLAGFLVASAAAALVGVYFLMSHYMGYMTQMAERAYSLDSTVVSSQTVAPEEWSHLWASLPVTPMNQTETVAPSIPEAAANF